MKWFFIGIEICMLAVFLYGIVCRRKIKNRLEKGNLTGLYMPVGRLLSEKWPVSVRLQKKLERLYPTHSAQELAKEYRARQVGQVFLLIMLCNGIWLLGSGEWDVAPKVEYQLERPSYEEGDRIEKLVVEKGQEIAEVEVTVPHRTPTKTQAEMSLAESKVWLEQYIQRLGTVGASVQLPIRYKDVLISYTAENLKIGEDGYVRFREITGPQMILADLACDEYHTQLQFELIVSLKENLTLAERVEDVLQEAELTQTTLLLPRSLDSEELSWHTPQQQGEVQIFGILLWMIPFLIIPLGYQELNRKERERQRQIVMSYPGMIQKLTVFLGAGLSIQAAWERIVLQGDRKDPLMEEMNITRVQMRHGTPMQEALGEFGRRIRNPELRRLANMLSRNLRRGDEFLLEHLKEMNQMAWEEHKKTVKIQSEEAETKLLLPMMLMLVVVLLIVLTPAMLTMNG